MGAARAEKTQCVGVAKSPHRLDHTVQHRKSKRSKMVYPRGLACGEAGWESKQGLAWSCHLGGNRGEKVILHEK